MKATLAMLACLSMVGLVTAATVEGNNTAVVIQKAATPSSTGFQFLCVPVAPLDITGGNSGTLTLAQVLPPTLYTEGTKVSTTDATPASYIIKEGAWVTAAVEPVPANDTKLTPGQVIWLITNANSEIPTVFCGQNIEPEKIAVEEPGITPQGNKSSVAKVLTDLIDEPSNSSVVFVIEKGKADYKQYHYYDGTWYKPKPGGGPMLQVDETDTIAAGEAFYYYKK